MNPIRIDGLQYCSLQRENFIAMRQGGLSAAHVTICYHEDFMETIRNITCWNDMFIQHADLIRLGKTADDIRAAYNDNRVAIFFGFQNCSPIAEDVRLLEILYELGARFMQLSYNNQSPLATGCYEKNDSGITRMGRQVITEMNRLGMVIDMSHSAERSTLEAIELSVRPIAITHANPAFWHSSLRNKSTEVLRALAVSGGILGLSLYPHHLRDGSDCTIKSFCDMVVGVGDIMGVDNIGIGSDLCIGQPDSVVEWMRAGRWNKTIVYGEGGASSSGFPPQPSWFKSAADFNNLDAGLRAAKFNDDEVNKILGGNWLRFYQNSFNPT